MAAVLIHMNIVHTLFYILSSCTMFNMFIVKTLVDMREMENLAYNTLDCR